MPNAPCAHQRDIAQKKRLNVLVPKPTGRLLSTFGLLACAIIVSGLLPKDCMPSTFKSDIYMGVSFGLNIPGDQDLKFKYFDSQGNLVYNIRTNQIYERPSPIYNVNLSLWGTNDILKYAGLRVDMLAWQYTTELNYGAGTWLKMPFSRSVNQTRSGVLVSLVGRVPFYHNGNTSPTGRQAFLFGGIGAGPVYTDIQNGREQWWPGYQLLAGYQMPIARNMNLTLEFRYLVTHDADLIGTHQGWHVETSGTPNAPRLDPHNDTRSVGITVGIDWGPL